MLLAGCTQIIDSKSTEKFIDISGDRKKEKLYVTEWVTKKPVLGTIYEYEITKALGEGSWPYVEQELLVKYDYKKPLTIKFKDINGDGNIDVIFEKSPYLGTPVTENELLIALGKGKGTFSAVRPFSRSSL